MATLQERYYNDCKKLITTLRIKSTLTAELINEEFKRLYGAGFVLETQPETWKYYLNMCGEYHHTDTHMTVTSLDTQEQIYFTKAMLQVHTATAEAYKYGSRYFYSLLARYPDQEALIFGILYPADMATALSAPDHTILAYDKQFVEPQEQTLMAELQDYIYHYQHRWHVVSFSSSDNLYPATNLAILYLNLISKLDLLRLKRCHTDEAHSFHIRHYLASNGRLDRYIPYMTLRQQLWLYRNLRYIQRHTGLASQFDTLIEKLFTDRNIPVSEYTIRNRAGFDDELYNRVRVRAKSINPRYNVPEVEYLSLAQLHHQESKLVYGNPAYQEQHIPRMDHTLKTRDTSVTLTKDLGSNMVDYSDAVPDTLTMIRLRQWAYMANHGLYRAYVSFKDPVSSEAISMQARDAFVLYIYLWLRMAGVAPSKIPMFRAWRYQRHPLPPVDDLLSVVDPSHEYYLRPYAEAMLKRRPAVTNVTSIKSFASLCRQMYDASFLDWVTYSNEGDGVLSAELRNMSHRIHAVKSFAISSHDTFEAWARSIDLKLPDYSYAEMEDYALSVYRAAVGFNSGNEISLGEIQRAMVQIMLQLSSYSIQFITNINDSGIELLNWAATRLSNERTITVTEDPIIIDTTVVDSHDLGVQVMEITDLMSGSTFEEAALDGVPETILSSTMYVGDDNAQIEVVEIVTSQHTLEPETD